MESSSMSYDKSMPNSKKLILFLFLFVLFLLVTSVGIFYLTKTSKDRRTITGLNQIAMPYEVQQLRQYEKKILSEYGIVDAQNGLYRIPIDKAIDKVILDYSTKR